MQECIAAPSSLCKTELLLQSTSCSAYAQCLLNNVACIHLRVWLAALFSDIIFKTNLQVTNKQGLAAAARQVWLAVHPDKNHATGAQQATQEFGKLLGSYKEKGLL